MENEQNEGENMIRVEAGSAKVGYDRLRSADAMVSQFWWTNDVVETGN